ncbi:MAG: hypothetical protein WBB27_11430 [Maribacter sp.]
MNRRIFTKRTAALLAITLLPKSTFSMTKRKNHKLGLQAFSIRDAMNENLVGSLEIVKSLGYEDLELYGFNAETISYYGHKAEEFNLILDDLGLSSSSCHYGFSDYINSPKETLDKYVDACINGALKLNNDYITWPWIAPQYRNIEI